MGSFIYPSNEIKHRDNLQNTFKNKSSIYKKFDANINHILIRSN